MLTLGDGDAADAHRLKLAFVSNIGGKPLTTAERKGLAIYLWVKRGWVMQRIADALGVVKSVVHDYLADIVREPNNAPIDRGTDTLGRKKSSGRPKSPPKQPKFKNPKITPKVEAAVASAVLDDGKSMKQAAAEAGIGSDMVARVIVAKESGRREVIEADPTLNLESYLSLTAQQKLQALERRLMANVDAMVDQAAQEKNRKHMEEVVYPMFQKKLDQADAIVKRRRGVMSKADFNKLRSFLHTDNLSGLRAESYKEGQYDAYAALNRHDLVPEDGKRAVAEAKVRTNSRFNEAFGLLTGFELMLVSEKEMPTERTIIPKTREEMMARKAAATAERKTKRSQRAALKADGAAA